MSIIEHLEQLLEYGLERKLISIWDREYTRNRLYEALGIIHPEPVSSTSIKQSQSLPDLLAPIYKWAAETGRMEADTDTYRDLLSAKLMGCFVPAPSEVIRKFEETKALYGQNRRQRNSINIQRMSIIYGLTESPKMFIGRCRPNMASWK